MIFEHIPAEAILFFILYGITGVLPLIAALYLLLRRANAFAPGVTPPERLRRWTISFFAVTALVHVWWILLYFYSADPHSVGCLLVVTLDCVLMFTTFSGMLLAMLQDRCRPVWPALVAMIPFVALMVTFMVSPSHLIEQIVVVYLLLLILLFTTYMVFAIRRYGRWLNDNYADLENKKVWLSQAVALSCMLLFLLYVFATDIVFISLIHIVDLVLIGLLLWRVETLPQLEKTLPQETLLLKTLPPLGSAASPREEPLPVREGSDYSQGCNSINELSTPLSTREGSIIDLDYISGLLQQHCVDTQLYLQHDLTLQQLAKAVGTNRYYLSQYFSRQGITYNTYINNLRINHFISRCQEVAAAGQPLVAQLLARESGYHSYSTFSLAFKQRMGQSVTAWMHETDN